MMPKKQYMALSAAAKKRVKAKLMGPRAARRVVKGHGDYATFSPAALLKGNNPFTTRSKSMNRSVGAQLGGYIGSKFGSRKIGRALGGSAHALFKKLTGFGDYKVASNTIAMGTDPPTFATDGRGTIIKHREYLGDITSPGSAFTVSAFPINAGLPITFPWLAGIASQFEQYCVRGMVFEFKSMSADALNSTNTALGAVIMATQYNSLSPSFLSKAQMENHEFCTSSKPSESFLHPIECARGETPVSCLYTRGGAIPASSDQRLYDLGVMYIATAGQQASSVVGELWVTYDIELLKPQLEVDGSPGGGFYDHYNLGSTPLTAGGLYFGTAPTKSSGSFLGTTMATATATVTFVPQPELAHYFIMYQVFGASSTLTTGLGFTLGGTGVSFPAIWNDGTGTGSILNSGATCATQTSSSVLAVPAGITATWQISTGTLPGTITHGDLWIVQMPAFVTTPKPAKAITGPMVTRRAAKAVEAESKAELVLAEDDDSDDEEDYKAFLAYKAYKDAKRSVIGEVPAPSPGSVSEARKVPSKK